LQLDLSGNRLCGVDEYGEGTYTAKGITAIADALRVNGGLTSLDLSNNLLCGVTQVGVGTYTAEGITAIAEALRVNGGLTSINLSGNRLTNYGMDMTGIKELAAALGVNGALTALDLSTNRLMDEGVSAVCEAIQSNKESKLASLNFRSNGIGPGGANAVAAMVAVTGGLMTLNLSINNIGGEGEASIRNAVQEKAGFELHL